MPFTIYRIDAARVNLSGQYNPPGFEDTRIDVFAYLLVGTNQIVLVDTGVGEGSEFVEKNFAPERNDLVQALSVLNVSPLDVSVVVNSHLHYDHCGNNRLFKHARFYIQRAELEVARTTPYTVRDWFDFEGAQIEPVDGTCRILNGITLLPTPGHTPGHQSVLVATPQGQALIAAQAAFTYEEFLRGGDPEVQAHHGLTDQYTQSLRMLRATERQSIFFSHDAHGD